MFCRGSVARCGGSSPRCLQSNDLPGAAALRLGAFRVMTFDFALAPTFVKYYCIGIVVFLVVSVLLLLWQLGWLWFKLRRVNGDLSNLNGAEEFSKGFEGYSRKAKETLGLAWTEFVETLILPESESHDPIRNTSEVSRYLNDATIVSPKIFSGFYHAVPNLLTGVGILGTFLGLAAGVGAAKSGLSSEDPRQITAALQQLLGGASLAFMTSIAGIGCSILFVFVERFTSRRLHLALGNWVGAIESRLERVTSEGVALEQLDQAKRTTTQLERFNTDLIFSLEQALEEKIAGRLSPQLEQLLQAVEGLREDRATDSGQMIEQALVRFTDALQKKTGSQFEDMATTVDDLNRTLKESADAQAQTQREVRGALDSVLTSVRTAMHTGATAMTDTLKQSLDEVRFTDALQKKTGSQFEDMATTVDDLNRTLKESADAQAQTQREVRGALDSVLTSVRTAMHTGATAMTDTLKQSLDENRRSFRRLGTTGDSAYRLQQRSGGGTTGHGEFHDPEAGRDRGQCSFADHRVARRLAKGRRESRTSFDKKW